MTWVHLCVISIRCIGSRCPSMYTLVWFQGDNAALLVAEAVKDLTKAPQNY